MAMTDVKSVVLVGCGNMGGAMLAGWLAGGMMPATFTVIDPVLDAAPQGVALLRDAEKAPLADVLVLGVKPQVLGDVAPDVRHLAGAQCTLVSILAGVEMDVLAHHFPDAGARVRLMPNLAAAMGKSPLALASDGIETEAKAALESLLDPLGAVQWLAEDQFHLVTALAGSGPAFVYRFIDALGEGAAALGMEPGEAARMALSMVEGAVALAASADVSAGELARRVASPGGTTEAGLKVLDEGGAMTSLIEATLRAARDRSEEMAEAARS